MPGIGLGGVLVFTLLPGDAVWQALGFARCLACGPMGTLDAVHNVLLFVPVGGMLVWLLRGRRVRALWAAGLGSLGIELLQLMVPGRDASVTDFAMNMAGALVGVTLVGGRTCWLSLQPRPARILWFGAALFFLGTLAGTAVLIRPALVPPNELYGQWAPVRPNFDPFRGRVLGLDVGGIPAPHGLIPDQLGIRAAWAGRARARLDAEVPVSTGTRPVLLARLIARDDEVFLFAERRGAFWVRVRLRAADAELRSPFFAVPGPAVRPERVSIEAALERHDLLISLAGAGSEQTWRVPLEITLGWALLLPVDIGLGGWWRLVSACWVGLLAIPLGFGAAWPAPGRRPLLGFGLALGVLAAGLGGLPLAMGVAPSHWSAWLGGAAGILGGRRLSPTAGRDRVESRTARVPPSP